MFQKGKKKLARDERELINVLDNRMENLSLQRLNLEKKKKGLRATLLHKSLSVLAHVDLHLSMCSESVPVVFNLAMR